MQLRSGKPYPLGATYDGSGVNFSLFSSVARSVDLCIFDESGDETRYALPEMTGRCWHGYFPGLRTGQKYGFRVHGPWSPADGLRCNPSKLLLDPYARHIHGKIDWCEAVFGHILDSLDLRNDLDSAPHVPRSVITDEQFDWEHDRPLRTPWENTLIYEVHVKGFTIRHPDVPSELRGTYPGLAHPAAIEHFKSLGVTAIELMPVQHFVHDMNLLERGLCNYWGYNTIGFFAPHADYFTRPDDSNGQVDEFKQMVKSLHEAGLEVILDVVYAHTAEGNQLGPTFSFKGIDNPAYYRLDDNRFYYRDYTGTGNSLNAYHPNTLQLLMDSLRYWVTEMHVDGFRFDLAPSLARTAHEVDRVSPFLSAIHQDPVISQVKLIAEPWDVGDGGYQLGNFPPLWSEWNGQFRDCVRDYWRGHNHTSRHFSLRLAGSPDLYEHDRRPSASINFVASHDGFTLVDLVSYNDKHNIMNGECNMDGHTDNRSWNCGAEGITADFPINALRAQQQRNLLATVMLSQGVPMLLAGDELGRTQCGNNNAYCQDNDVSWIDWQRLDHAMLAFTRRLIALRQAHPVFRKSRFTSVECAWYRNDGRRMTSTDWDTPWAKAIATHLAGGGADSTDDDFYIAFNPHSEPLPFTIPVELGDDWRVVLHTSRVTAQPVTMENGTIFRVGAHSLLVLSR